MSHSFALTTVNHQFYFILALLIQTWICHQTISCSKSTLRQRVSLVPLFCFYTFIRRCVMPRRVWSKVDVPSCLGPDLAWTTSKVGTVVAHDNATASIPSLIRQPIARSAKDEVSPDVVRRRGWPRMEVANRESEAAGMRQSWPPHARGKPPCAAKKTSADIPLMPVHVPKDLDNWMRDRNLDLQEALSLGDGPRVSELILKLSEVVAQMSNLTGVMQLILPNARQVSLCGYRGVQAGEASHPGPPKSPLRRYPVDQIARNVAARVDVSSNPRSTL